ncbi:MAG TPA: hypothetical protein VNI61_12280 [Gemmatimonadales bacterium]|nr:hypothetical protein [Gemmatimonadales bacterium]
MATYQLRPMSVGEILDGAFTLLRRNLGVLLSIAVICQGIPTALGLYVEFAGGMQTHFGLWAVAQILSVIGYLLVTGATVRVVSEAYLGRSTTLGDALRFASGKMGGILLSGIAVGLIAMLGFVLLVIPGIIALCGYAVVVQVVVLENLRSSLDALGRSWSLTKGFKGKALVLWFVLCVFLLLIVMGFGVVVAIAAALAPVLMVPAVVGLSLVTLLVYPLTSCVFTLLYYDLRVRKEAFDLELLSQQIALAPSGA